MKLSVVMNSIFILFNLHSVISELDVSSGNRRHIYMLACYAYNYGGYHSLPRTDTWCQCPARVYGLSRQQIADLPPVTGKPPLMDSDMKLGMLRALVSFFFFYKKKQLLKKRRKMYDNFFQHFFHFSFIY